MIGVFKGFQKFIIMNNDLHIQHLYKMYNYSLKNPEQFPLINRCCYNFKDQVIYSQENVQKWSNMKFSMYMYFLSCIYNIFFDKANTSLMNWLVTSS